MRDYAKIAPTFWTGETGRELRRRASEGACEGAGDALLVAAYLISSPHSNMLGLFYQPVLYTAEETGLGLEGASKGLQVCIEVGFCKYDPVTKMVWVVEMARWQIGDSLKSEDKRCKGVQKEYDALADNPFLAEFFDRYSECFHMTNRRLPKARTSEAPYQGPSKHLRSQEQEQEQEQEHKPPIPPKGGRAGRPSAVSLTTWLTAVKAKGEKAIPDGDAALTYADEVGLPVEFLHLAWKEFRHRYSQPEAKRYRDWRAVFRKAVRGNWLKLWWLDGKQFALTTAGMQAKLAHGKEAA